MWQSSLYYPQISLANQSLKIYYRDMRKRFYSKLDWNKFLYYHKYVRQNPKTLNKWADYLKLVPDSIRRRVKDGTLIIIDYDL